MITLNRSYCFLAFALFMCFVFGCGTSQVSEDRSFDKVDPVSGKSDNLLIVTIDTLRADHLSCYGYPRPTSPMLDRLARSGITGNSMICTAPYTNPSHASLFTGLYPWQHGCRSNYSKLEQSVPTLAKLLKKKGYHTAAFVSGSPLSASVCGLDIGFDVYDDRMNRPVFKQTKMLIAESHASGTDNPQNTKPDTKAVLVQYARRDGCDTIQAAKRWLDTANAPWFLWIHLYDVHGPYQPPFPVSLVFTDDIWNPKPIDLDKVWIPEYQRRQNATLKEYISDYDSTIYHTDNIVEDLVVCLNNARLFKSTLTCILSDHGESLGEHQYGFDHGKYLYQPCLHIPFIMCLPDRIPGNHIQTGLLSEIDILPTIWKLMFKTDIKEQLSIPGDSNAFMQNSFLKVRYAETKPNHPNEPTHRLFGVMNEKWKYVYCTDPEKAETYNLETNPEETKPERSAESNRISTDMRSLIKREISVENSTITTVPQISELQKDQLKNLGYIE